MEDKEITFNQFLPEGILPLENPQENDPVNHPSHYTSRVPGIECIDVVENFNFNRGGAIKYIWRAGLKDPNKELEDLRKARWLLDREIHRLEAQNVSKS